VEPPRSEEVLDRPPSRPRRLGISHRPVNRLVRDSFWHRTRAGGRVSSAWLFDVGARIYSAINAQAAWLGSCDCLAAHLPHGDEARVLDLGCGPGFSTLALARARPDARVVGLDLAPRMLAEARRQVGQSDARSRVSLLLADAASLPFGDECLDVITGHSFLYLVDRPEAVLSEVLRVLRRGGRVVLMEPNDKRVSLRKVVRHSRDPRFLFSALLWRPYSRLHGRFVASTLEATLAAAGFEQFGFEEVLGGLGLIGWASKPGAGERESGRTGA
jgi:ubiquinone/menaquinone biosynthesis C-methylase UbiE